MSIYWQMLQSIKPFWASDLQNRYFRLIGFSRFMPFPLALKQHYAYAFETSKWRALPLAFVVLLGACGTSKQLPDAGTTAPGPDQAASTQRSAAVLEMPIVTRLSQFECASELPLKQRAGQLMFPLVTQSEFSQASELASTGSLGGVVVLGSPDASIRQDIANYQKRSLFGPGIIAVDEEGGRVQRLSKLTTRMPSAQKVAAVFDPGEARQLAANHALAIGDLGFTMNLAPVADLNNSPAIGDRAFGRDPAEVTAFAMATANGIIDSGLVPVLKHFPGHGRASDSHHSLPLIPGVDVLQNTDLVPFKEVSGRNDIPIMMGHLVVNGLTDGQPASVSPQAVDGLLRGELGFDGLVMTDAFNMDAISATMDNAEAAERAIAAGVDLVMLSSLEDADTALKRVVSAVGNGRISDESITESFVRVMQTRAIDVCELPNS